MTLGTGWVGLKKIPKIILAPSQDTQLWNTRGFLRLGSRLVIRVSIRHASPSPGRSMNGRGRGRVWPRGLVFAAWFTISLGVSGEGLLPPRASFPGKLYCHHEVRV